MKVRLMIIMRKRSARRRCRSQQLVFPVAFVFLMGLIHAVPSAIAQDAPAGSAAVTTSDVRIPLDHLKVKLRPLNKAELETELKSWLALLKAKITEVGSTELKLKELDAARETDSASEADAPPDPVAAKLNEQLVALRTKETALTERTRLVIEELKRKGGDVAAAQSYIDSVSDLRETTDATSFVAAAKAQITVWVKREDGGQLWLKRAVFAAVVLLVFWVASKFAGHLIGRSIARHPQTSTLLENFARRTAGGVVFVVGVVVALATLGVPVGPLMAALGGGGFIVGFALQETLGNFASGLLIMIYRPFDLDDYVRVAGAEGTVKRMSLVSTTLSTPDNKLLVIPNKLAWGGTIANFTGSDVRRVDLLFAIRNDDDIQHAIDVLTELASSHALVLNEPAPAVEVEKLGDSVITLSCQPWVKTGDYGTVRSDLTRAAKEHFDAEGINLPKEKQTSPPQPTNAPTSLA